MSRKIKLIRSVPIDELTELYKKGTNARIKQRLLAILHLYEGRTGLETAKLLRTSYSSIRRWAKRWNKKGHNGLIPHFTGGPKPKITSNVWDKILGEIENKGMTLKDVKVYVKTKYGVDYDYNSVWYWVRKKKKTRYGKPYLEDERRPKDAEEILKKG